MKHPYHCVLCGTQLDELGLGLLGCPKCETDFIPMSEDPGGYISLMWTPKPEDGETIQWRDLVAGEFIEQGDEFFSAKDQTWKDATTMCIGKAYDPVTVMTAGATWHAPHRRRVP